METKAQSQKLITLIAIQTEFCSLYIAANGKNENKAT